MNRNQEVLFAQTLEKLRKLAKEQFNCVSEEQVRDAFQELDLNEDQFQMVFDYLVKHKVGIGTPVDMDDYLSDEEKNYLDQYLLELEALPVYSEGELEAAVMNAMAGEAEGVNRVIEAYLKAVVDMAKIYTGQGVLLEDLIGEGNVALSIGATMLGSLEKPSEAQGMLGRMIMDAMEELVAQAVENEKTDKKVEDKVNKVADKARELAAEFRRKVTVEELAQETGMSKKAIMDACRMSGRKIEDIEDAEDNL